MSELESDVKQLQDELERQQVHLREADREKTRAVQELSEQNQRLLDQLSKVSHKKLWYRILKVEIELLYNVSHIYGKRSSDFCCF